MPGLSIACFGRQQPRPSRLPAPCDLPNSFGFTHYHRAYRAQLFHRRSHQCSRLHLKAPTVAIEIFETAQAVGDAVQSVFALISASSPPLLQPAIQLVGSDLSGIVALHPTGAALARFGVRWARDSRYWDMSRTLLKHLLTAVEKKVGFLNVYFRTCRLAACTAAPFLGSASAIFCVSDRCASARSGEHLHLCDISGLLHSKLSFRAPRMSCCIHNHVGG